MISEQKTSGNIVFPDNPEKGDIYIVDNGKAFMWDGITWVVYELPPEWKDIRNKPFTYPPPRADRTDLGGVIVGRNLTIDPDGTLHALGGGGASTWDEIQDKPTEFPPVRASNTVQGGVKIGRNIDIDDQGYISVSDNRDVAWDSVTGKPLAFPPTVATQYQVGGVKQGANIVITEDGTISAKGGGGGSGIPINDWERIAQTTIYSPSTLVAMNQAEEDVTLSLDQMIGAAIGNPTYCKNDGTGWQWQIFPGYQGISFAVQSIKIRGKISEFVSKYVPLKFPLTSNTPTYETFYSATVNVDCIAGKFETINASPNMDYTGFMLETKAATSDVLADVRLTVIGYIKTPKFPVPSPPPPFIDRITPMNGGMKIFFRPQPGTIPESVYRWGFETRDVGAYSLLMTGPEYRVVTAGVDDDADPMLSNRAPKSWLRGLTGPIYPGLPQGTLPNDKPITWRPYAVGQDEKDSPYGVPVTQSGNAKAILHQPKVLDWTRDNNTYTVRMQMPDGVSADQVQGITWYHFAYDDEYDLPYLHLVGSQKYGSAQVVRAGDIIEAVFTLPAIPAKCKRIFFLSLENEHGTSPDSQWQFDPPLAPVIVGPRITQLNFDTKSLALTWTNPDPREQVFLTKITVESLELEYPFEDYLYGNPQEYFYDKTEWPTGEYKVTVTCFGFNGHSEASDDKTTDVYPPGQNAPPIITKIMPTYDGALFTFRYSPGLDLDKVDSFIFTIEAVDDPKDTRTIYADIWAKLVDVDGIDDEGYPFMVGKLPSDKLQLVNGKDYVVYGVTRSKDGIDGPTSAKIKFQSLQDAPQGRIVIDEHDYNRQTHTLTASGHLYTLSAHTVLNVYARVIKWIGDLDDEDNCTFAPEEVLQTQWTLFQNELSVTVPFDRALTKDENYLVMLWYETDLGFSPLSWFITDSDQLPDQPGDPLPPKIDEILCDPLSIKINFTGQSPDKENTDYYGYACVLKDPNGNVVFQSRLSGDNWGFEYKPGGVIPGGKYMVWVDALGYFSNVSTFKQFDVPDTGAPLPPEITALSAISIDKFTLRWDTKEDPKRIDKFEINVTDGNGWFGKYYPTADKREWTSESLRKGTYFVSMRVQRDTLWSIGCQSQNVTLTGFLPKAPKITKAVQQGTSQIYLEWQDIETGPFDHYDIMWSGPSGKVWHKEIPSNIKSYTLDTDGRNGSYFVNMLSLYQGASGGYGPSSQVEVQYPGIPKITSLVATAGDVFKLTWDANNPSVDEFKITVNGNSFGRVYPMPGTAREFYSERLAPGIYYVSMQARIGNSWSNESPRSSVVLKG